MKKNLYNYSEFNLENIDNNSFIYVYLDPRRPGEYKFREKENEIKEFLKTFRKNKNQFS